MVVLQLYRKFTLKKIIIKSALTTFGIVVGFAVVVFVILSFGFPSTAASWSYQLGNNGIATKYAALYYSYTGETDDLATCTLYAISSDKDSYIIEYCEKLIDCDDFSEYCDEYDASYSGVDFRQYIYGRLARSYYFTDDLQSAIGVAVEALDESFDREQFVLDGDFVCTISSFPVGNALGTLALSVINSEDGTAAAFLLEVLENVQTELLNAEQLNYFNTLQTYLKAIA